MNDDSTASANDAPRDDLLAVLDAAVDSVEALDALLIFIENPTRWWAQAEIARAIGLDLETTRDALRELRMRGVITDITGAPVFRLAQHGPVPYPRFVEMARMCVRHRTAVVDHVSRRAIDRVRVIAAAFTRDRR